MFPVVLVITMMQIFSGIRKRKLTVQAPYLFLKDNDRNRLMTTLVFGFFSQNVINLIWTPISDFGVCTTFVGMPEIYICNFFVKILLATLHGMKVYPLFALITSPNILIASLFGIFFVNWHLLIFVFYFDYYLLPMLIFLLGLWFGFIYRISVCIKTRSYEMPDEEKSVVLAYQINHVRQLIKRRSLVNHEQSLVDRVKGLFKPWYKFPPVIFHILVVILSFIYSIGIPFVEDFLPYLKKRIEIEYLSVIWFVVSILVYMLNILHFLFCVQQDTFSVYTGNHHKLFDKKDKQFNLAQYHHIAFPAYLVSAMFIGLVSCSAIVGIVVSFVYTLTFMSLEGFGFFVRLFFSFYGVGLGFNFVQRLIIRYYLTDSKISKLAINLKHVRIFYVLAFFMYFVNIIKSGMSFFKRLLMTVTTLLLFFGRIDRNPLMFFKRMDISATYGSFLRVENVFKNPTMRLFCQILLEPDVPHVLNLTTQDLLRNAWGCVTISKRGNLNNSINMFGLTDEGFDDNRNRSKVSKISKNRWHLAYTLINNPSLVKQRRLQSSEENTAGDNENAFPMVPIQA